MKTGTIKREAEQGGTLKIAPCGRLEKGNYQRSDSMNEALKRLTRLVPGKGGDSFLIEGDDKTAAVDTGMLYCSDSLVHLAEEKLGARTLDYVLLTHSHYDHAGGTPALRKRWPGVTVVGSPHARDVLLREGARKTIRRLSQMAGQLYEPFMPTDYMAYKDVALSVDQVVKEGTVIELGGCSVNVLETPGHTNCSLSYLLRLENENVKILFTSESIGCYTGGGIMVSPFLTGYQTTLNSIEKCRYCKADIIVSPHYGLVSELSPDAYLDLAEEEACRVKDFILRAFKEGEGEAEILRRCIDLFWTSRETVREEQPLEAFTINMKATIQVVEKEFFRA